MKLVDLGLTYEQAAHGVQTAIKHRMDTEDRSSHDFVSQKHLRTGIDMSKADMLGLAYLLIKRGVITQEEYVEAMRLAANHELNMHETEARQRTGITILSFR